MTTKLEKELKREIEIGDAPYTLTISPTGLKLTAKGKRNGHELTWKDIVKGDGGASDELDTSPEEPAH